MKQRKEYRSYCATCYTESQESPETRQREHNANGLREREAAYFAQFDGIDKPERIAMLKWRIEQTREDISRFALQTHVGEAY